MNKLQRWHKPLSCWFGVCVGLYLDWKQTCPLQIASDSGWFFNNSPVAKIFKLCIQMDVIDLGVAVYGWNPALITPPWDCFHKQNIFCEQSRHAGFWTATLPRHYFKAGRGFKEFIQSIARELWAKAGPVYTTRLNGSGFSWYSSSLKNKWKMMEDDFSLRETKPLKWALFPWQDKLGHHTPLHTAAYEGWAGLI